MDDAHEYLLGGYLVTGDMNFTSYFKRKRNDQDYQVGNMVNITLDELLAKGLG